MNMRASVDIDLIVYSFVQNLQNKERLGSFISFDIRLNSPVEIKISAENTEEVQKLETAELLEWVNRYKEHAVKHEMPIKETYSVRYDF